MHRQHQTGRQQTWKTADHDICHFLDDVVEHISELLAPAGFVGAYLHGSLSHQHVRIER